MSIRRAIYTDTELRDDINALRNAAPNPWMIKMVDVTQRLHCEMLLLRRKIKAMERREPPLNRRREKIAANEY
jgi:hypothetical protein